MPPGRDDPGTGDVVGIADGISRDFHDRSTRQAHPRAPRPAGVIRIQPGDQPRMPGRRRPTRINRSGDKDGRFAPHLVHIAEAVRAGDDRRHAPPGPPVVPAMLCGPLLTGLWKVLCEML